MEVTLEWGGGAQDLFGNTKTKKVFLKEGDLEANTIRHLLKWLKYQSGLVTHKPELFFSGETVRPGILVLVNGCDWELCDELEYKIKEGDCISFISTLHGG